MQMDLSLDESSSSINGRNRTATLTLSDIFKFNIERFGDYIHYFFFVVYESSMIVFLANIYRVYVFKSYFSYWFFMINFWMLYIFISDVFYDFKIVELLSIIFSYEAFKLHLSRLIYNYSTCFSSYTSVTFLNFACLLILSSPAIAVCCTPNFRECRISWIN